MAIQEEARKGILAICSSHKGEPSPLMPILEEIQKKYGYIPLEVQELVSKETGVPVSEIYGVVTFYNFFSLTPKGKYVIGVCLGTACYVKNSQAVLDKFQTILGIEPGQTTADGLFTIEAIRCMGACALAPAVSVNGKVYPQMTVDGVNKVIDEYKAKEVEA
jgi:NADH:ubiquinone oxidoreductase subunit E